MSLQPIPDKLYFKISEVSKLVGVKPYVLRYWETEFNEISPVKSRTNQRLYKRRDVELLLKIKELLYKEKFTINGARKRLKSGPAEVLEMAAAVNQLGLGFEKAEEQAAEANRKAELKALLQELLGEMQSTIRE